MTRIDFAPAMRREGYRVTAAVVDVYDTMRRVEIVEHERCYAVRYGARSCTIDRRCVGADGVVHPWAWHALGGPAKRIAESAAAAQR